MAQGAVALPANGAGLGAALSAEELREILEYERIVQFRDAIVAGTHPRVKAPPHLAGKQVNPARNISSPGLSTPRSNVLAQPSHSTPVAANDDSPASLYNKSPNNLQLSAGVRVPRPNKSEINPILLEKSDDLIKAEIQLQRQKLERTLREQIEQQRIATKALLQTSESLPTFDISEVLSKALAIVHPATEVEPSVGARSSASDSFDENTFYSSQHDTPALSNSSLGQKEFTEKQLYPAKKADERPSQFPSNYNPNGDREVVFAGASQSSNHATIQNRLQPRYSPPLNQLPSHLHDQTSGTSSTESTNRRAVADGSSARSNQEAAVSDSQHGLMANSVSNSVGVKDQIMVQNTNQDLLRNAYEDYRASPLIRAHNLSPIAPQPARVSPLATARNPPVLRENQPIDEAQPAQVAALRMQAPGISSTDSSPKGGKGGEKRKEKKKKKRRAKDAAGSPDSTYIKTEPRSVSPFAVAPLRRPQKRQRQSGQYAAELSYDEPREDADGLAQQSSSRGFREIRASRNYERYDDRYEANEARPQPLYRRVEREDEDYRRANGEYYARQPEPSPVYALPYSESRPIRTASRTVLDRRAVEEPRYYREPIPRPTARPDGDRERSRSPIMRERKSPLPMAPPRKPVRIVIDEYGNEYFEPTSVSSSRQSVAPAIRYRDPELVYERAPMRAVSARAPIETYEDDGVYRRQSPPMAASRRVITQPEYAAAPLDYRSYRQREYSARPMASPSEDFVQTRGAPDRRQYGEQLAHDYAKASSLRPESMRYEVPREYSGRLPSVRPEGPPREYAASVRPEVRREPMQQPLREYSVRPMEPFHRREHMAVPEGERYYEEIPSRRPVEVAFIERPRARESSVMVYADDVRREVYK